MIFNAIKEIKDSFNKEPLTLNMDESSTKDIIKQFNELKLSADAFTEQTSLNDESLKSYFKTVDSGKATYAGYTSYINSANASTGMLGVTTKITTFALKAFKAALSTIGIMLAVTVIQSLVSWIDKLHLSAKEITENAIKAKENIDELTKSFDEQKKSIEDIKKRYAELAQGVDLINNKNLKLSTEDYQEFLNLSNKLSELFPELTRGYDSNGNAILNLSGNVNTIVGSLDALIDREQQLLNLQILKEMPDVYSGYKQNIDKYNKELDLLIRKNNALEKLMLTDYSTHDSPIDGNVILSWKFADLDETALMDIQNEILNSLQGVNIDLSKIIVDSGKDLETGEQIINLSIPEIELSDYSNIETILGEHFNSINDEVKYARSQLENETSNFNSYLNTWLTSQPQFVKQEENIQSALKDMLFNGNWISEAFKDKNVNANDWDSISNWIERNYLYAIEKVDDTSIKNKIISLGVVKDPQQKLNVAQDIQNYFDKHKIPISLDFVLNENIYGSTKSIINSFNQSLNDISNGSESDSKLLENYTDSFDEPQMNYWNKITYGIQNAFEAIKIYEESINSVPDVNFITEDNIEKIDKYKNKISDLSGYLSKISSEGKLSSDEISKLNIEYGIFADSIQEYKKSIIEEMNASSQNSEVIKDLAYAIENCDDAIVKSNLQSLYETLLGINTETQESTESFYNLEASISTLESSANLLRELNTLIEEQGYIDTSKSNEIVSQFPEMAEAVAKYNSGLMTSTELFEMLKEAYDADKSNYAKAVAYKMRHDENYFDKVVTEMIPDWVKDYAKSYEIDLINYRTLNEQKLALDKEYARRKNILDNHTSVMDATKKIEESSDTIILKHFAQNIGKTLEESYKDAKENFDAINKVISEVENSFTIDASWEEFGKNESGSSSGNNTTEIDWADQSLDILQNKVDKFESILENTNGIDKQLKAIDNLNNALKDLRNGYKNAYKEYEKRYNASVSGLGDNIRYKIESGQSFNLSKYDSDYAERIQNAINYYNKMNESKDKIDETDKQILDNKNLEKSKLRQESYESQLDTINTKLDSQTLTVEEKNKLLNKQLSLQNAINKELINQAKYEGDTETVSKLKVENKNNKLNTYLDKLKNNKEQNQIYIDTYEEKLKDNSLNEAEINNLNNNLQKSTNKDFSYQFKEIIATIDSKLWDDYISALKETYNETDLSDTEFIKKHIEEIVSYFDYTGMAKLYQDYLNSEDNFKKVDYETKKNTRSYYINNSQNEIQDIQNDIESQGGRGTEIQYKNMVNLYDNARSYWIEQKEDAEAMLETCDEGTAAWNEWNNEIQECENNIAECDAGIKDCYTSILKLPLNYVEDALKDIKKKLDEVNESLEDQDDYISTAIGVVDLEIENQETLREAIQDKLDALQEENELRETNLAIQKAEWELEKLKNQKTNKVFQEGQGWIYESNPDDVQNAQQAYDEAIYNKKIYLLNEQLSVYDDEIRRLNDIKDTWSNITEQIQFTNDLNKALTYDSEFYTKVLEQDLTLLNSISTAYSSLVAQKSAYETQQEDYTTLQDVINETVELYNLEGISFEDAKQRIAEAVKLYYPDIVAQYKDEEETLERVAEKKLKDAGVTEETSEQILEDIKTSNEQIIESYTTLVTNLNDVFTILDALMSNFARNAQVMALSVASSVDSIQSNLKSLSDSDFNVTINSDVNAKDKIKKVGKSHSGLELGYVGENSTSKDKETFKVLALDKLDNSELLRVVQKGEAILTDSQVKNVMDNFRNLVQVKVPTIPLHEQKINQSVNFNGDIVVQGNNGDINSFAKSIKQNLPNAMLQTLYANK